jgi:uncharacterized protein YdaU (DUF1376 family)
MNYYKRHLGDYAAATRHLSILEHGVYTLLLDTYYINEKPLPADERALYRIVGARGDDEREAVGVVLREFFDLREDGWHQPRCDAEIAKRQAQAETNRLVGRRGGRPQKTETESVSEKNRNSAGNQGETPISTEQNRNGSEEKTESVSKPNRNGTKTEPNRNPSHKPLANNQEKALTSPTPPQAGGVDGGGKPAAAKPGRETAPRAVTLPPWLPAEDWQAFVEHRRRLRAAMTDVAQTRAIAALDRLRADGHQPVAVINQSIIHGWKGLFPLHQRVAPAAAPAATPQQEENRDVVSRF